MLSCMLPAKKHNRASGRFPFGSRRLDGLGCAAIVEEPCTLPGIPQDNWPNSLPVDLTHRNISWEKVIVGLELVV
eukprot:8504968-Ditylum_brightwellii.AAC.1